MDGGTDSRGIPNKGRGRGGGSEKGGGERGKEWKEMGGSTGLRPPAPMLYMWRSLKQGPPKVPDKEYGVNSLQGAMDVGLVKSAACQRRGKS